MSRSISLSALVLMGAFFLCGNGDEDQPDLEQGQGHGHALLAHPINYVPAQPTWWQRNGVIVSNGLLLTTILGAAILTASEVLGGAANSFQGTVEGATSKIDTMSTTCNNAFTILGPQISSMLEQCQAALAKCVPH